MTAEKVKDMLHASPFAPFTLHLLEQTEVRVPHPDFALLTRGGILVVGKAAAHRPAAHQQHHHGNGAGCLAG